MRHLVQDDLTLLYYGELPGGDERSAREHLAACTVCRQRQEELLRLFALVDKSPVPEPADGFEADVWRRLQPTLRASDTDPGPSLAARLAAWLVPPSHRWAMVGGLLMVVLVAFTAGRFWPAERQAGVPAPELAAGDDDALRERILLSALGDHFDRTQVMLVELAGTDPDGEIDISGEQGRAADLLAATRLYRAAAVQAGDANIAAMLEALERMLVEVTVAPATLSGYELQALQSRIAEQEWLFKLRVASSSLRQKEQSTRPLALRGSAGV